MSENRSNSRPPCRRAITKGCLMRRTLTANPRGQLLATATGAVFLAWACSIALPAHAQAATVGWSSQKPPAASCGPSQQIATDHGYAKIRDCLIVKRSARDTYYSQGVLEIEYHRLTGNVGDVLGAKSMLARVGNPYALGVNDCRPARFILDHTSWCYSPTKQLPRGQKFYGKGILVKSTGGWYQPSVWSPLSAAVSPPPGNQSAPTSKEYTAAMAHGFGPRPAGATRRTFNSGVTTGEDGVIVAKFFIPNRWAASRSLHGDNRSWSKDPNTARRSRVYLTWDVATGKVSVIVNKTTTVKHVPVGALPIRSKSRCRDVRSADLKGRYGPADPRGRDTNDFYVGPADGGLLLCMSALNSLTSKVRTGALSVDGALSIVPNRAGNRPGLGGYRVAFNGNGYPTTEIYYYPRTSSAVRTLFLRRIDPHYAGNQSCVRHTRGRPEPRLCDPSGGYAALDSNSYWWCFNGNQTNIHQKSTCTFDANRGGSDRIGERFDTNDGDRPG